MPDYLDDIFEEYEEETDFEFLYDAFRRHQEEKTEKGSLNFLKNLIISCKIY